LEFQPVYIRKECSKSDLNIAAPSTEQLKSFAELVNNLKSAGAPIHVSPDYLQSWTIVPKPSCRSGYYDIWLDHQLQVSPCPVRSDEAIPYLQAFSGKGPDLHPTCRMCRLHSYWELNLIMASPCNFIKALSSAFIKSWPLG